MLRGSAELHAQGCSLRRACPPIPMVPQMLTAAKGAFSGFAGTGSNPPLK